MLIYVKRLSGVKLCYVCEVERHFLLCLPGQIFSQVSKSRLGVAGQPGREVL